MTPDSIFAINAFRHFNDSIFSSSLPLPKITLTHARTFRGKLVYRVDRRGGRRICTDFEMRLSVDFDLPQREWEDVIIHEMIHLRIASQGMTDTSSHGEIFRSIMKRINSVYGRNIVVAVHRSGNEPPHDNRVRGHYICIARFADGRYGVAPVAKTRIFRLWDTFAGWQDLEAVSWVGCVDTWFNRFPRVMTPKFYIASREDLIEHMRGAVRLVRDGSVIRTITTRESPEEILP